MAASEWRRGKCLGREVDTGDYFSAMTEGAGGGPGA